MRRLILFPVVLLILLAGCDKYLMIAKPERLKEYFSDSVTNTYGLLCVSGLSTEPDQTTYLNIVNTDLQKNNVFRIAVNPFPDFEQTAIRGIYRRLDVNNADNFAYYLLPPGNYKTEYGVWFKYHSEGPDSSSSFMTKQDTFEIKPQEITYIGSYSNTLVWFIFSIKSFDNSAVLKEKLAGDENLSGYPVSVKVLKLK